MTSHLKLAAAAAALLLLCAHAAPAPAPAHAHALGAHAPDALRASVVSALETAGARVASAARNAAEAVRAFATGDSSFTTYFNGALDTSIWAMAHGWANGQPFKCGWDKKYQHMSGGALNLDLKKDEFQDPGSASGYGHTYPYTSGEIRSRGFYGEGCFSVCMKPSKVSGVSSSFYALSGDYDTPHWLNYERALHNEIDIEFVGWDTTKVQTNYFSRYKDPHANSGTGVEEFHDLGFDAGDAFHSYAFKWTGSYVEWYVDGKKIRHVKASESYIPSPSYSPMRILANVWPVNEQAEEWAGPLDPYFYQTSASYRWIKFTQGSSCSVPASC